jgi:hypothetical protein
MKIDFYTKAVLTVIAACLLWMCVNTVTPAVGAQAARPEPAPVVLVDAKGTPIYTSEGLRVNVGVRAIPVIVNNQSLPVAIANPPLPVMIANPSIQVQVMRDPPTLMPTP